MRIAYCYFDLPFAPHPGWEFRTGELLQELGHEVFFVPKHSCESQKKIPLPPEADVVYCSNPMCLPIGVELKKKLEVPLVVNFLDIPERGVSEDWRFGVYEKLKPLVEKADGLTAISQTTAGAVESWCGRRPEVDYLGVDEELFSTNSKISGDYACSIPRGLAKQKCAEEAARACEKFGIPLKVIYGQYSDIMRAKLVKGCHFGLHTSHFEGFCLPIIEFNYCHKPVVARRLPVLEEIHSKNRGAVLYDTQEELEHHLKRLWSDWDERWERGRAGQEFVLRNGFTLRAHAERLIGILEQFSRE